MWIYATELYTNTKLLIRKDLRNFELINYVLRVKKTLLVQELIAKLIDSKSTIDNRNYLKLVTGKTNYQKADHKDNASVFLFFPVTHFLKTILASSTNGIFGFVRHTSRPFAKPKEPFFANAPKKQLNKIN